MMAPDLHPDELLDRAAAGALGPEDRARLDAHLAACVVCRFEAQARLDFAALPDTSHQIDDLVTRALAGMPPPVVAPMRRGRRSAALIAAAVMLVGAGSFAAIGLARPLAVLLGIVAAPPMLQTVPVPSSAIHRSAPLPPPPPLRSAEVTPEPPAPPPLISAPGRLEAPRRPVPVATVTEPPPIEGLSAGDLFREATRARTEGRFPDAEQGYRQLTERFPSSSEALVSRLVLGRLLLDLKRPAEALVELDAALGTSDATLREDVLATRALAFDAQGNDARARRAWGQLLQEFPASIHAGRARERLQALSTP